MREKKRGRERKISCSEGDRVSLLVVCSQSQETIDLSLPESEIEADRVRESIGRDRETPERNRGIL